MIYKKLIEILLPNNILQGEILTKELIKYIIDELQKESNEIYHRYKFSPEEKDSIILLGESKGLESAIKLINSLVILDK